MGFLSVLERMGCSVTRDADSVTVHEGWGLGSYCYYNVAPTIVQHNGFAAPNRSRVKFHDLLVVYLGGSGGDKSIINGVGGPVTSTNNPGIGTPVNLISYP